MRDRSRERVCALWRTESPLSHRFNAELQRSLGKHLTARDLISLTLGTTHDTAMQRFI